MRTTTRSAIAAVVCLSGLAAAGCSTDTPRATPTTPTVTRTVTTAPANTPAEPADDAGTKDTATATTAVDTPCGPYADASAKIAAATARIAPPSATHDWTWATTRSVMTSCNQLSWAELTTDRGTAASADQLLLFGPDGRWLGTGIRCNAGLAWVRGSGGDHVDVHYGWYDGPDATTADPGGGTEVTFRWNGSRVVMEGTLPQDFLDQCEGPG